MDLLDRIVSSNNYSRNQENSFFLKSQSLENFKLSVNSNFSLSKHNLIFVNTNQLDMVRPPARFVDFNQDGMKMPFSFRHIETGRQVGS